MPPSLARPRWLAMRTLTGCGMSRMSDLRMTHRRPHDPQRKSNDPGVMQGTMRFDAQHLAFAMRRTISPAS